MDWTDDQNQAYCFAAQVEWTGTGSRSIYIGIMDVEITSVYEQTNKNLATNLFDLANTVTVLGIQFDKEDLS